MLNGKKIKMLRKNLKLTQKELAKMVNVTNVSICGYEKNNRTPDIETLESIAKALNTSPNYLLDFDVEVTLMVDEDKDDSYNQEEKTIYVSNDDLKVLDELKKYNKLKNQIYSNPNKWFNDINKKFN